MMLNILKSLIFLILSLGLGRVCATEAPLRIVSLGGNVTDIVYALGAQAQLVATDQSSLYPEAAQRLPSVGYYRQLPVEGVVSMRPTLVIASEHAGPTQVLAQLSALNIRVVQVSDLPTLESLKQRVRQIALVLDRVAQGETLLNQLEQSLSQTRQTQGQRPKLSAITIVMRGGKILGAGRNTAADVVLHYAGLTNVLSTEQGYRPISAEAMNVLAPELIITTSSTLAAMGSLEAIQRSPILKYTPAAKNNRVLVLDDLLVQGFGLRLPQAIHQIWQGLVHASEP